jgi:hypothetical protein
MLQQRLRRLSDRFVFEESSGNMIASTDAKYHTREIIEDLVVGYTNYNKDLGGSVPIDDKAFKLIPTAIRNGDTFITIRKSGSIVGGLLAAMSEHELSMHRVVHQRFYFCSESGLNAVRAIQLAHTVLINEMRSRNASYIFSQGNFFDLKCVFARTLEKIGWIRNGHLAIYRY